MTNRPVREPSAHRPGVRVRAPVSHPGWQPLITAVEGAWLVHGPASTRTNGSLARILLYDLASRIPLGGHVCEVAPRAEPSAIFAVNGIVEMLPIDDAGTMLVMERSFSVGAQPEAAPVTTR